MANQCNNRITVTGDTANVQNFLNELLVLKKDYPNEGILPKYVEEAGFDRYLFDVDIDSTEEWDGVFYCWTKWAPPIDEMRIMAQHHKVNIEMIYEEMGCQIYGQWSIIDGNENDISLDDEDFARVVWDDDEGVAYFDGEKCESDYEALEKILFEKIPQTNL